MQQKLEYSEKEVEEQCTIIKEVGPNLEYEQSTREIPAQADNNITFECDPNRRSVIKESLEQPKVLVGLDSDSQIEGKYDQSFGTAHNDEGSSLSSKRKQQLVSQPNGIIETSVVSK